MECVYVWERAVQGVKNNKHSIYVQKGTKQKSAIFHGIERKNEDIFPLNILGTLKPYLHIYVPKNMAGVKVTSNSTGHVYPLGQRDIHKMY